MSISIVFGAISSWNASRSLKSQKKSIKSPILAFKVIEFSGNLEPVYDFVLVISSILGPILHRFWDTATYWLKIANFPYSLLFSTPAWYDSFLIYGKALRILKLESSRQLTVKIWLS